MTADDFILLSDEELVVAAGFLGRQRLYGVSSSLFKNAEESANARIEALVKRLEEKRLISLFPDGTVSMQPLLYDGLRCMAGAERILLLEQKAKTLFYRRDQKICRLEKRLGGVHKLSFLTGQPSFFPERLTMDERLDAETIRKIRAAEDAFDPDEAYSLMRKQLKKPKLTETLLAVLRGGYTMCRYWEWSGTRLSRFLEARLADTPDGVFEIEEDQAGNLLFSGKLTHLDEMIHLFFEK